MKKLWLPLLLFSILSCSESHDEIVPNVTVDLRLKPRSTNITVDPSNSNNPIDSVGRLHNEMLDVIAFDPNFETLNILTDLYTYAETELGWEDPDSEILLRTGAETEFGDLWTYTLNDDYEGYIDDLDSRRNYSQNLVNALYSLISVLSVEREFVDIEALIDDIKTEEAAFANGSWTTSESRIFYGTASILRYSAAYWDVVVEDENHPYFDILYSYLNEIDGGSEPPQAFTWKKFWRAMAVIGADALGFAGGFGLGSSLSGGNVAVGASAGVLLGTAASAEARNVLDP